MFRRAVGQSPVLCRCLARSSLSHHRFYAPSPFFSIQLFSSLPAHLSKCHPGALVVTDNKSRRWLTVVLSSTQYRSDIYGKPAITQPQALRGESGSSSVSRSWSRSEQYRRHRPVCGPGSAPGVHAEKHVSKAAACEWGRFPVLMPVQARHCLCICF